MAPNREETRLSPGGKCRPDVIEGAGFAIFDLQLWWLMTEVINKTILIMLSSVLLVTSLSAISGFSMSPKASRRILNVQMNVDPWFPKSTTTNVVDVETLE